MIAFYLLFQASVELSTDWTLMKSGMKDVPSLSDWLADNMRAGAIVGIDPWYTSVTAASVVQCY